MRLASQNIRCWIAALALLAAGVNFAHGGDDEMIRFANPKVIVTYEEKDGHGHKHKITKIFDLANDGEYEQVRNMLREGHVHRIVREDPVNVLDLSWDLGLWTVVVFGLLFLILKKMAWGPMLEGLRKREENIQGAITDAQKARDEAKDVRDEVQRRLDRIGDEIRAMMDDARRKAETLAADMTAKARQEIQSDRDRLRHEIELARDQALQELWGQTAQLATLVSAKTLRRQLDPEDHRRLIDEALVELRQAGAPNGAAKAMV